jgi:hypothetical protein
MKRLVTLAIMVAFLLGTVGMVKAAELTISGGDFRVHGNYVTNPFFDKDLKDDKFNIYQRFRTSFNFVANENLRAVVQLQFGGNGADSRWGGDNAVTSNDLRFGAVRNVVLRQSFLQFNLPNTRVMVKAGHQYWALPNTLGSHIFDARSPAVVVSTPINDMVKLTLGYARSDDNFTRRFDNRKGDFVNTYDEIDHFLAIVPITMDGINLNPFFHYAHAGKYLGDPATFTSTGDEKAVNIFFAGINATVDMLDPIVIHADFNYGSASKDSSNTKGQAGWIADLAVAYKMDMMTPMVFALYESGETKTSARADKTGNIMPRILGDLNFSSFSTGGSQFGGTAVYAGDRAIAGFSGGATGKMALGLKVTDISFMDKLTHKFLLAYYQGTNHKDNVGLFTTKDKAYEVNFDTRYQMYENLAAIVELGYIKLDLDNVSTDDSFKAAAGFRYLF